MGINIFQYHSTVTITGMIFTTLLGPPGITQCYYIPLAEMNLSSGLLANLNEVLSKET